MSENLSRTEPHEHILGEVLQRQGVKKRVPFHVFHDISSNAETSEQFSEGVIVISAVAPVPHESDSKDEISDVQAISKSRFDNCNNRLEG